MESLFAAISVNDVLEELKDENARLSRELLFANKCVRLLMRFKSYLYDYCVHQNKCETDYANRLQLKNLENEFNVLVKERNDFNLTVILNNNELVEENTNNANNLTQELRKPSELSVEEKYLIIKAIESRGNKTKTEIAKQFNISLVNLSLLNKNKDKWINIYNNSTEEERKLINHKNITPVNTKDINFVKRTSFPKEVDLNFKNTIKPKPHESPVKKFKFAKLKIGAKRRFHCDWIECNYSTGSYFELKVHKNKHLGVTPYVCNINGCSKAFYRKNSLRNHKLVIHELKKTLTCSWPTCMAVFKTDFHLSKHMKTHTTPHLQKPYACEYPDCNYRALYKISLDNHRYVHSTEKPFSCHECGKGFKTESSLKQHLHTHNIKQQFRCDWNDCAEEFNCATSLRRHKIKHLNVDTHVFRCDWPGCDYKSDRSDSLGRHKVVHTNERNFPCTWPSCEKRLKTKKDFREHLRIHTNDKRYKCQWPGCDYRCVQSGNLRLHFKIHCRN